MDYQIEIKPSMTSLKLKLSFYSLLILFLVLDKSWSLFSPFSFLGLYLKVSLLVFSLVKLIIAGYKLIKKYPIILVSSYGIIINNFESAFEDLSINRRGQAWIFSNGESSFKYTGPLSKKDFLFIENGFKSTEK